MHANMQKKICVQQKNLRRQIYGLTGMQIEGETGNGISKPILISAFKKLMKFSVENTVENSFSETIFFSKHKIKITHSADVNLFNLKMA